MTALPNSAEIGLIEVKFSAIPIAAETPARRRRRPPPSASARARPASGVLADRIGGRTPSTGIASIRSHNAERKDPFGDMRLRWALALSSLAEVWMSVLPVRVQRRRGGDDIDSAIKWKRHTDRWCRRESGGIPFGAICFSINGCFGGIDALILGFLRACQKNRYGEIVVPRMATMVVR